MPNSLEYSSHCDDVTEQTRLFLDVVRGADPGARVPTCPEWDLRDLVAHLGQAHRHATALVRARAEEPVEEEAVPGWAGPEGGFAAAEPADLEAWLADGAEELRRTLRATAPDAPADTWFVEQNAGFLARRAANETAVHRADACRTTGAPYALRPDRAADCLDEWLTLVTSSLAREYRTELQAMDDRAGDLVRLHATDAPALAEPPEWLLEFHAGSLEWRRTRAEATVTLSGPLTEVMLAFLGRCPLDHSSLEVLGDRELLETWLQRASF